MKVAIFDFDGTIYKHETFSLMMDQLKKDSRYGDRYRNFYLSIILPYFSYKLKLYPEEKMKLQLMQKYIHSFEQEKVDDVNYFFKKIAANLREHFHPLVIEKMENHAKNKDYIMVVSGAFTPILTYALQDLPIDAIIGTEIPSVGEHIDSTKEITHIQAEKKTECILNHLKDDVIDWKNSYAYGDTISDLPMLEMVGNPVAVCPDLKLQTIANEQKWMVLC